MNKDYKEVAKGLERLRGMEDTAIVVEGINDKKSLERLGVESKTIFTCIGNADKIANTIKGRGFYKAVILTDFDKTGNDKERELKPCLESYGIKVYADARDYFRRKFLVTCIEDMIFYSRHGYAGTPDF